jgi:hypothetical protein
MRTRLELNNNISFNEDMNEFAAAQSEPYRTLKTHADDKY